MSGTPAVVPPAVPTPYAVVPPPPPGPGVQAPFVAPPTDGARRRRGWAIGLSIGAVVLICLGGVAGVGALAVLGARVLGEQAEAVVIEYLTALRDEEYDTAYGLLCDPIQASTSRAQFQAIERTRRVVGFSVQDTILNEPQFMVPVRIDYENGSTRSVRYVMYQDQDKGGFEVCGEAD